MAKQKIFNFSEIDKLAAKAKVRKAILVGGCFDIFHFGHLEFLREAKKKGNFLIVALESDKFIREKKKKEPVHSQLQRAEILAELEVVDAVLLLPYLGQDSEYFKIVKIIKPAIIAVTEGDPQLKNKEKQAKAINSQLKIVSKLLKEFSTSKILKKL